MSTRGDANPGERAIYAIALAVALIAGLTATWAALSDSDERGSGEEGRSDDSDGPGSDGPGSDGPARESDSPSAPRGSEAPRSSSERSRGDGAAGVEFTEPPEPGRSRAGTDFMPSLPEVPDLATEPPPDRPVSAERDPRMERLGAEMRILSRARDLIGEHPAEALGVLQQHRRQYPRGVLREEREALAIEVLLALEHSAEAERRYYDFLRDFPESAFREGLREAMERPPHRVGASGR